MLEIGAFNDQVLDHYHHLYQIEHAFRTFKGYLETRPMFHSAYTTSLTVYLTILNWGLSNKAHRWVNIP